MNYQEAEQVAQKHSHLEGEMFNGKTISKLLIAPLREVGIARLMYNLANDIPSDKLYENYTEFEIWIIFDLEDWEQTGVLDKLALNVFLTSHGING